MDHIVQKSTKQVMETSLIMLTAAVLCNCRSDVSVPNNLLDFFWDLSLSAESCQNIYASKCYATLINKCSQSKLILVYGIQILISRSRS